MCYFFTEDLKTLVTLMYTTGDSWFVAGNILGDFICIKPKHQTENIPASLCFLKRKVGVLDTQTEISFAILSFSLSHLANISDTKFFKKERYARGFTLSA